MAKSTAMVAIGLTMADDMGASSVPAVWCDRAGACLTACQAKPKAGCSSTKKKAAG